MRKPRRTIPDAWNAAAAYAALAQEVDGTQLKYMYLRLRNRWIEVANDLQMTGPQGGHGSGRPSARSCPES
jgi:hypothetical protein